MQKKNNEKKDAGEQNESTWDMLLSLFVMIKTTKKWWLLPFLIILAFLSLFVKLTGNSSVLPAIYALF